MFDDVFGTYSDTIRNLLIIITSNFGRIDHVFSNQLDSSIADSRRAVKKMAFDCTTDSWLWKAFQTRKF